MGRRKPKGYWQPKGREEAEREARDLKALKARKDAFVAEDIEAELNTFKKGTYMFDAKAEAPKKAASPKSAKPNGHSKFLLKRANQKHPPPPTSVDDQRQVLMHRHRMKANGHRDGHRDGHRSSRDGHRSSRTIGPQGDDVKQDREERRPKKSRDRSRKNDKLQAVPTVAVTVSPSRHNQYGAYGAVPDYFQGPGHGPSPSYGGYGYAAPNTYAYGPPPYFRPPPGNGYGNGYGYPHPPPHDFDPTLPPPGYPEQGMFYPNGQAAPGAVMEDGAWYPYGQPAPVNGYVPQSTPKKPRKSATVDLTSPTKAIANGDVVADKPMSPGRRVNKIQKQLEFYFSVDNMMVDKFLQKCMDDHGWVKIQDILGFKRLKGLRATKELVTEAAFHSTLIEVDPKSTRGSGDRIRMNKLWKQFVPKQDTKKKASSSSSRTKLREKDLQKQKELDAADLNGDTIEAIVAAIEKQQESRERRRRERARQKEKA